MTFGEATCSQWVAEGLCAANELKEKPFVFLGFSVGLANSFGKASRRRTMR
ncbi:hypothetical protein EMIT0P395_100082 [Pseudomonas sp. IT-P395]